MKKICILLSVVVIVLMGASCEKEESGELLSPQLKTQSGGDSVIVALNRTFYDNGVYPGVEGDDYGCSFPGYNCFPDKDVHLQGPPYPLPYDPNALELLIDNNNNTAGQTYLNKIETDIQIFTDHAEYLTHCFSEDVVHRMISGSLRLSIRSENHHVNKFDMNYFVFRKTVGIQGESLLSAVYPINTYTGPPWD